MPRPRPGFYHTIEYIGPRPQKPKRRNFFGGWVIVLIAVGIATWFGRPLVPFLKAAQEGGTTEQAQLLAASLGASANSGDRLAAAALELSRQNISFDPSYYKIPYPDGDIPASRGAAADVLVRCFRKTGIDLQRVVHDDMADNFRAYPQVFGNNSPDPNIDHRRIANLQRFFERHGERLETSRNLQNYRPGDIVVWSLANAESHIGIVVPGPGKDSGEPWVVHHMGDGMRWEDALLDYKIEGHFRYPAAEAR